MTRHDDQKPPEQIVVEIWNPLAGVYEPMDTIGTGLFRLAELVEQVRIMRVQHDPRRESLRVRPESCDGISMTCSVAGDRFSWYAANKAKQFQWQHPWWYPQLIEMTPNVSGQTLKEAPDPPESGDREWAELRVSAQASREHETPNVDQPGWKKAASTADAIRTTCNEIGYIPS